ncbi:MAG: hypothetical protein JRG73_03845 [Deltaproteobacteria bacterium]|nr:hypothetical protein [Deltaproteobacteria bacterium]MBW2306046.1 hypothetical protein [Deltaproteobacteria bacterium]
MEKEKTDEKQSCFMCGTDENQAVLLQARKEGDAFWVCVHCLPVLIHG